MGCGRAEKRSSENGIGVGGGCRPGEGGGVEGHLRTSTPPLPAPKAHLDQGGTYLWGRHLRAWSEFQTFYMSTCIYTPNPMPNIVGKRNYVLYT